MQFYSLYLSLFAGYAVQKFGFKSVVLVGGAFIFVGFLYMWLAILQALPSNIQSICFFYFLSQAGVCCHISSAVTVSVKLFPPEARGAGNANQCCCFHSTARMHMFMYVLSDVFILALHTLVASLDIIVVDRIKKLYVDNVLSE